MLARFFSNIKTLLAAAGFLVLAIGVAFLRGRAAGKAAYQSRADRRRAEALKAAREIENEVDSLGSDQLRKRANRWVRDDE